MRHRLTKGIVIIERNKAIKRAQIALTLSPGRFMPTCFRNKVKPIAFKRAKRLRNNMTQAERILWNQLKEKKLNGLRFRSQSVIFGWIADFYCPKARLVVELDGSSHNNKVEKDNFRDSIMKAKGFRVLRFRNESVYNNLESVLNQIGSYSNGLTVSKLKCA